MKLLLVVPVLLMAFVACEEEGGWPEQVRENFVRECVVEGTAQGESRALAEEWCECGADIGEERYTVEQLDALELGILRGSTHAEDELERFFRIAERECG